ncbi:MAG: protein-L-isoaspartate O-methyltransferase [Beijerinckiaceae bacterium]
MNDFARARRNMVDCQIRPSDVTDHLVLAAFDGVERERFLPDEAKPIAYLDRQIAVGCGRELLTPMTFARMTQALTLTPKDKVLDIACGLGYSTAVLAALAGKVVGLECEAPLAEEAARRLEAAGIANATAVVGDLEQPPAALAPFNAIMVNGALEMTPDSWLARLAEGGRLACVMGVGRSAQAILLTKSGSRISQRILFDTVAPALARFRKKPEFAF